VTGRTASTGATASARSTARARPAPPHADLRWAEVPTPLGPAVATATDGALVRLALPGRDARDPAAPDPAAPDPAASHDPGAFPVLHRELAAYTAGEPVTFTVACDPPGTAFQRAVWQALAAIPWGVTWSYRDVAAHLGRPRAVRAVATAIGANPIAIVAPCHRVIGADGTLTGFSAGLDAKRALLALEGAWPRHDGAHD